MIISGDQLKQHENSQVINFDNLAFYFAARNSSDKIDHLIGYDAIIIDATDPDQTRRFITKFRGHYNQEYYLKPVFLYNTTESSDPYLKELTDGIVFSLDNLKEASQTTREIFLKSTQLDFQVPASFEGQVIKKMLNYLFTREKKELHPYPSVHSSIGYLIPVVSVNFSHKEEWQAFEILDLAEKDGLFQSEFAERVYLCNQCSGGFLSYREVCPHCNSSNSASEDLVHHFPCAYIGPISDFQNVIDHQMHCPKCNKALRHIGVDYDKPSVIHHCKNCSQAYQDFSVKAKCLGCLADTDVQFLVPRVIKSYTLTKKGESCAVNGYMSASKELDLVFGTVNMQTFKTMMQYEIERIKITEVPSYLAVLSLLNGYQLYQKTGNKEQKIFLNDFTKLVREKIRKVDVIAFENASNMLFLFPSHDLPVCEAYLLEIMDVIKDLVKTNFHGFELQISHKLKPVGTFTSPDTQVQYILQAVYE